MKKTLIALIVSAAAVGLAVEAAQQAPASPPTEAAAVSSVIATPPAVEWGRPQAPFDEREMTPVETAGASRPD